MAFLDNIENAIDKVTVLARIRPRYRITAWIFNFPNTDVFVTQWRQKQVNAVYSQSFESAQKVDSILACENTDYSFFHDEDAGLLYFNPTGTRNPVADVTVVEWDWLVASEELNWFLDPTSSVSGDAVWSGGIIKSPIPLQGGTDLALGFLPIQISSIEIQFSNGEQLEFAHAWSLNKAQIKVWQCVGDLRPENISEVFTGVCGNYNIRDGAISIQVYDPIKSLEDRYDGKLFNGIDFPSVDPNFIGTAIPLIYGFNRLVTPVNIDYSGTPSTTNNRDWCVSEGDIANAAELSRLIDHTSGNNTATTTQLFDASGFHGEFFFNQGDSIIIKDNGVNKYARITAVDYDTNIITHSSIGARSPVVTDTVERSFVGIITIRDGGAFFDLQYGRDYLTSNFANGTRGFILTDNFEANYGGLSIFDPSSMILTCRVYGDATLPKKLNGITDFGEVAQKGGAYSNPVTIAWDILRNKVRRFGEIILLDETSWSALSTAFDRPVGVVIPPYGSDSFPSWQEVFKSLLQSELLKLHYKIDSGLTKLMITQIGPSGSAVKEISTAEISGAEFNYSYDDIYEEVIANGQANFPFGLSVKFRPDSQVGKYLHRSGKSFEFNTLFAFQDDLEIVAQRMAYYLSERKATLSAVVPLEYLTVNIDDSLTVKNEYLPGFPLGDVMRSRDYSLIQHSRGARAVSVILDDKKGVEDNAGDW